MTAHIVFLQGDDLNSQKEIIGSLLRFSFMGKKII